MDLEQQGEGLSCFLLPILEATLKTMTLNNSVFSGCKLGWGGMAP